MYSPALTSRSTVFAGLDALEVDLAQPAIVPDQWEWGAVSLADVSAEARLMLAVLDEAISSVERLSRLSGLARAAAESKRERRELKEWFESTDRSYMFSFESICATCDIDAAHVRNAVRRLEHSGARRPRRRGRPLSTRFGRRIVTRAAVTPQQGIDSE